MTRIRFPIQTLPMMFVSAILATCVGDNGDTAKADEAPSAVNNVAQVQVVETKIASETGSLKASEQGKHYTQTNQN